MFKKDVKNIDTTIKKNTQQGKRNTEAKKLQGL